MVMVPGRMPLEVNSMFPFVPVGAAAGMGLSELAGGAFDVLDAPRRMIWESLLGTSSGSELMGRLGMDPEGPWAQALGLGAEMLLDPLNLVGAGLGAKAGKLAGHATDVGKARKAIGAERASITSGAKEAARSAPSPGGMVPVSQAGSTYHPGILESIGDPSKGRAYKRVNPEMARHLDEMGIAYNLPEGGMMFPGGKPGFLKGKGGVLGQSMPMPWRSGYDAQMMDQLGNSIRLPDQMDELLQATFRPAQLNPQDALSQAIRPQMPKLARLNEAEAALGAPGALERALGALRFF